jgi:monovalent cation:proton antiporter-2 (CPA2) family protein
MVHNLFLDIVILLTAAVVAVPLFRLAGIGAVPGFLVAGVVVGPSGLGLIDNVAAINQLSELGVVLLLFIIGIELKPSRLWLMRRLVFGLGTLQVLITGALIAAAAHFMFDVAFRTALIVGPALALSSTAFVLQLLSEQKMLNSDYGRSSVAILLLQDLAVVPLLALVPLLAMPQMAIGADIALAFAEALAILLLVVLGGRYLLQPILYRVARAGSREVFTALAVLLVLGVALLTEHIGLSMAMGAFMAGLLIADSPFRHQVVAEVEPFRGLFLGLFFMSMGMFLSIDGFIAQPLVALGLLVALFAVKILVLFPLAMLFGLGTRTAAAVALLLAQSGEFGLVLFGYTQQAELMSAGLFQQLLIVIVLSMLVTPPLAHWAFRLAQAKEDPGREMEEPPASAPFVLAGFGRVGRRIGEILSRAGAPYVAVDNDADVVRRERDKGHRVFYGDARQPEVLRAVGATECDLVIITLDDFKATEDIVVALEGVAPDVTTFARAHDAEQCRTLRQLGASLAVSENLEASLELARAALARNSNDPSATEALLQQFRDEYYSDIVEEDAADNTRE